MTNKEGKTIWMNHGDSPLVERYQEELIRPRKCDKCGEEIFVLFPSGTFYVTHGVMKSTGELVCPGQVIEYKENNE